MNLRTTLLVPLVVAAAACGRQDAAPFVAPDAAAEARGTATIKMVVVRDTATSRTAPRFAPAGATAGTGQTRVNLFRANDTTLVVRTGLTNAIGEIVFGGLAPGDYVLKPVIRSKSTTAVPATGVPVKVAAGSIVTVDTLRLRLSTRISGVLQTEWFDQVTLRRIRHAGVKILVDSETVAGGGNFVKVDSITTNATGSYEYFRTPGPERIRLRFNSTLAEMPNYKDSTAFCSAIVNGVCQFQLPYTRKEEAIVASQALTATSTAANNSMPTPGRDILQNLTFNYPTRITGFLYRDRNNNSFRDSTLATTTKEGLVAGDTITVQLRDSTGSRVIATTRFIATASTAFASTAASPSPMYAFNSVAPGKYIIRLDRLGSRFGSNPLEFFEGPTYTVVVPAVSSTATAPITLTQDFGLRTGQ